MKRRTLFKTGLALAGGSLLASASNARETNPENKLNKQPGSPSEIVKGRRKLGQKLEVSSIGLGVQNMPRTYQTTIPSRPEMINIIRKAYENGVTLFDTAEVYGPLESERILGEAVAPFRDKIVIETKFFRSRPEQLKEVVEGMI
jgi:Aldo/keto reductase family